MVRITAVFGETPSLSRRRTRLPGGSKSRRGFGKDLCPRLEDHRPLARRGLDPRAKRHTSCICGASPFRMMLFLTRMRLQCWSVQWALTQPTRLLGMLWDDAIITMLPMGMAENK